jgi:hypothetical protein
MSFVVTVPELLEAAAGRLHVIGSAVSAANVTAAFPITGVIPAAADEVSAATAAAFSGYGQAYQAISAEAALIHDEFVRALGLGANSYAATEAANAAQAGGVRVAHVAPPRMAPTAPARMTHVAPPRPAPTPRATPAFGAAPAGRASYGGGYGGYGGGYGGVRPATHGGGYAGGNYGGGRVDPYARFSYGAHAAPYAGGYGAHAAPAAPAHPAPARPAPVAPAHPAPPRPAPTAPTSPTPNYPGTVQPEHYVPAYPSPAGPAQALPRD